MRGVLTGIAGAIIGFALGITIVTIAGCGRGPGPCTPRAAGDGAGEPSKRCEVRR